MNFCVYGLRLKGYKEVRYIGQTSRLPHNRLQQLRSEHTTRWGDQWHGDSFGLWLRENGDCVEAFEIARCTSRAHAKATERTIIALCLRLEHRLFNGDHVPSHLRTERGSFAPLELA